MRSMRYLPEHKSRTRGRIIEEARRSFLCHGHAGIGVDGIMMEAGLTAGGFYSHFESKDALFALALENAFESSMAIFFRDLEKLDGPDSINELTRRYLSRDHRDDVAEGCPLPQLATDVARSGGKSQTIFESRLKELVARMAPSLAPREDLDSKERALALLALYVGGLTLARAMKGRALSDQVLLACRKQARLGQGARRKRLRDPK
jgi:TetR/AcrR family transcriptional regulator, transcriptional repressor for nem operon